MREGKLWMTVINIYIKKLDFNNRKPTNSWNLNKSLLNNYWFNAKGKKEARDFVEFN